MPSRALTRRSQHGVALLTALVAASLLAGGALGIPASLRAATGTTLYVDGKHGSDSNSGLSWQAALKTIYHAAQLVPHGNVAGWKVIVRGYDDYVYRGRPNPGGYDRWGSSTAPLIFQAEGWTAGGTGYVKPIVSGGLTAPSSGHSWQPSSWSKVWVTPWSSAPIGFDPKKPYNAAIFQDETKWLWQRASLDDLRSSVGDGRGGYWFDAANKKLYVVGRNGVDPRTVSIEVPSANGFYFSGAFGAKHIEVRGFRIRHAAVGIAFVDGADYSQAVDNEVLANQPVGIHTAGRVTGSTYDAAIGNKILRNVGSYNTLQAVKVDAGSRGTRVCFNTASRNSLQGIKVQGPDGGASDPRVTSDTEVCDNALFGQNVRRLDDAYGNGTGITIESGALSTNIHDNEIWDNHVGIHVNQRVSAGLPIDGLLISHNLVWSNSRFGINFRDGVIRAASGTGSVTSSYNLYWRNGIGVRLDPGSRHKVFDHDTVWASVEAGFSIGCACSDKVASATIRNSLSTNNGTYGVVVLSGDKATVSYVGVVGNPLGGVHGSGATRTGINKQAAGYLATVSSDPDFLRISTSSYQYDAGLNGTPIGARW